MKPEEKVAIIDRMVKARKKEADANLKKQNELSERSKELHEEKEILLDLQLSTQGLLKDLKPKGKS